MSLSPEEWMSSLSVSI